MTRKKNSRNNILAMNKISGVEFTQMNTTRNNHRVFICESNITEQNNNSEMNNILCVGRANEL